MTWQPIATAPKDGQHLLLYSADYGDVVVVARWDTAKWWVCWDNEPFTGYDPTHWMPLPEPPTP